MSFLAETDVNKRKDNLVVAFEAAPSGPLAVFEVSADNAIQFFAQYAADFPGLAGNSSSNEWAQIGANGEISVDFLQASMTGVCGAIPIAAGYPLGALPRCAEITCVQAPSDVGSPLRVAITTALLAPSPPDLNSYTAGQSAGTCAYYQSDGQIFGLTTTAASTFAGGDVIGVVLSDVVPGVTYATTWYLNGINQGTVDISAGPTTYLTLPYIG